MFDLRDIKHYSMLIYIYINKTGILGKLDFELFQFFSRVNVTVQLYVWKTCQFFHVHTSNKKACQGKIARLFGALQFLYYSSILIVFTFSYNQ